jgi:pimeloyl-ACP methyl ester carboxylesterase
MAVTGVFIHGLDSSSRGTKGSYFAEHYPQVFRGDYQGDLEERMARLEDDLAGKEELILVGSSFGGLMAALFACRHPARVRRLVLLAPALEHGDFSLYLAQPLALPVLLVHGRQDEVVAPGPTERIARRLFSRLDHRLVEDDHNLHQVFPLIDWEALLEGKKAQESLDKPRDSR